MEEKYTPHKRCVLCGFEVFKQDFQLSQWNRADKLSCCRACVEKQKEAGTPYECANCHIWKTESAFAEKDLSYRFRRVCKDCDEKRVCRGQCGLALSKDAFTDQEWREALLPKSTRGKCLECMERNKPEKTCKKCKKLKLVSQFSTRMKKEAEEDWVCLSCQRRRSKSNTWICIACKTSKAKSDFSLWLQPRSNKNNSNGRQRCNQCMQEDAATQRELQRDVQSHIVRTHKL